MTGYLIVWGVSGLIAVVAGSLAAAVTAWKLKRGRPVAELPEATAERDPWIDAEIDCASVQWAERNGFPPEAAGLMSARLKTLHDIGQGKGWV